MNFYDLTSKRNSVKRGRSGSKRRLLGTFMNWYVWIILGLFWTICLVLLEEFQSVFTFRNIFLLATPLLFVAFGEAVVIITGGFDLSVGAMVSFATAVASETMRISPVVGILSVLMVGLGVGAVNGLGVVKGKIDSFIMTLGTLFVINGLALFVRPMPGGYIDPTFSKLMLYTVDNVPLTACILFVAIGLGGVALLEGRSLGRELLAIGGDREKAKRAGVRVDRIEFMAYVISGASAAIGGLVLAGQISAGDAQIGLPYLFNSFIAVVLGGTLGGVGAFLQVIPAVLLMTSLRNTIRFLEISTWYDYVIKGMLLVVVVAVQQRIVKRE